MLALLHNADVTQIRNILRAEAELEAFPVPSHFMLEICEIGSSLAL